MLKSYLLENYDYNEPIFLNELSIEGLSENAVRQSVKRLVANGFLERYDSGIYYIPKQGSLLGKSYLDPLLVIMRKYIGNKSGTYGYITGISFVNQLGLTTQVPAVIEIVTNKESTNGRMLMVGNQKVRVKKAPVTVSDDNAELLQLLDGISQAEKYTELPIEETIDTLLSYVKQKKFTKKQLSEVSSVITGATAKKLIEWGMIYEFAS
jgi:DNA-binding Lrp family transcriptional regulator